MKKKYDGMCGKYEGILPTIQTLGTKKNSELSSCVSFGTWKNSGPSLLVDGLGL